MLSKIINYFKLQTKISEDDLAKLKVIFNIPPNYVLEQTHIDNFKEALKHSKRDYTKILATIISRLGIDDFKYNHNNEYIAKTMTGAEISINILDYTVCITNTYSGNRLKFNGLYGKHKITNVIISLTYRYIFDSSSNNKKSTEPKRDKRLTSLENTIKLREEALEKITNPREREIALNELKVAKVKLNKYKKTLE